MPRQGVALGIAAAMVAGVGVWAVGQHAGADDVVEKISASAPFFGSAAAAYADGAAGVTAPRARAMGGFTAAQVADAYAGTEKMIEAAALDRATLRGGTPTAFLATIDQAQAATLGARARAQTVSIAPGTAHLVGEEIKATGSMTASPATYKGVKGLHVSTDHTFVYALQNPKAVGRIIRFTAHVKGTTFATPGAKPVILEQSVTATPTICSADGLLHPNWSFNAPSNSCETVTGR